jgi:hypothetical protein
MKFVDNGQKEGTMGGTGVLFLGQNLRFEITPAQDFVNEFAAHKWLSMADDGQDIEFTA